MEITRAVREQPEEMRDGGGKDELPLWLPQVMFLGGDSRAQTWTSIRGQPGKGTEKTGYFTGWDTEMDKFKS